MAGSALVVGRAAGVTYRALARLAHDDDGQDLIEYALLTAIVAVAAAIALPLASELGDIYEGWNANVWNLWEPPPPGS